MNRFNSDVARRKPGVTIPDAPFSIPPADLDETRPTGRVIREKAATPKTNPDDVISVIRKMSMEQR